MNIIQLIMKFNGFEMKIYPGNRVLRFLLKQIVYPILLVVLIFFVLSYVVLLKTDKVTEFGKTIVYVSDDYTFDRDTIVAYAKYGVERLRKKGIDTEMDVNVVFCENELEYRLRNFFMNNGALAQNRPLIHQIVVAPCPKTTDVEGKEEQENNNDTVYVSSYIDQTISHELTHVYQNEKLGFLKTTWKTFTSTWKIDGFAEYIANRSSLRVPLGKRMFMEGRYSDDALNISESFFTNYFVGRLRTDYLLGYKHVSEDEYWDTDYDVEKLDEEIRRALKAGEYQIFRQNDYE